MKNCLVILSIACSYFLQAQTPKLLPKNEAKGDTSLTTFIDTLKRIVERKDANALLSYVDRNIIISFDNYNGIDNFNTLYETPSPKSEVWPIMTKLLQLGGIYDTDPYGKKDNRAFMFPYVQSMQSPEKDCNDCMSCVPIIVPDANVRERPDRLSPSVGKLNYDIVKIITEPISNVKGGISDNWIYIQNWDGTVKGWIRKDLTWDKCYYRMMVKKQKEGWRIVLFISGD